MRRDIFPQPRLPVPLTESLLEQAHARWSQSRSAQTWEPVTSAVFATHILPNAAYFLLYKHPVHTYLNRAYQMLGQSLKDWLDEQMALSGKVGLDIWILPEQQDWVIGCNHDGDIFANTGSNSALGVH
jgi:hypothetical protein